MSVPQKTISSSQAQSRSPQAHPVPNTHSQSVPKQVALAPPPPSAEDDDESDEDTTDHAFLPEVPQFKKGQHFLVKWAPRDKRVPATTWAGTATSPNKVEYVSELGPNGCSSAQQSPMRLTPPCHA